jgi:hypothetical protein
MLKNPKVNIANLRHIVDQLLAHVEKVYGPEFRLQDDYYWSLNDATRYDMSKDIEKVDEVGSLGDSWEFLLNLKGADIEHDGPSLMLIHAAPLLHYIGVKIGA